MPPKANTPAQPPATLTIPVNDEKRDFFMSFGLLDALTRIIRDPSAVPAIFTDPDLRDEVLKALLAVRSKSGKILEEVADVLDHDILPEHIEALLDWTAEHVTSFFVRSLKKVVAVTQKNQEGLAALESFLGGSTVSASPTPSAGS